MTSNIYPYTVDFRTSDGTKLVGTHYKTIGQSKGTLIFPAPSSATHKDYEQTVKEITGSLHFQAITYNQRGHDGSEGMFTQEKGVSDLIEITKKIGEKNIFLIGHSSSAALAIQAAQYTNPADIITFAPYINQELLSKEMSALIDFTKAMQSNKVGRFASKPIDALLTSNLVKKIGDITKAPLYFNAKPLVNTPALADINIKNQSQLNVPLLYIVPGQDKEQDTINPQKREEYRTIMSQLSTQPTDLSDLADGLNLCMNYEGFKPFFKEEPHKKREEIFYKIREFIQEHS